MREVAAAASVSVGTVSNVLNAPDKVAPTTVARVQAVIDQLGFVRNDAARQLKAGRSRSVGLVVLDIGNPFFTDIARAAERRAGEHNLTVLLGTSDDEDDRERAYIDAFDEQRVFGLLVSPVGENLDRLTTLRDRGTPVVLVDRDGSGTAFDSVAVDDVAGARLAVQHLCAIGRRRIATITGPADMQAAIDRTDGWVRTMRAAGLPTDLLEHGDFTQASGAQAMRDLLRRAPDLDGRRGDGRGRQEGRR